MALIVVDGAELRMACYFFGVVDGTHYQKRI